MATCILPAPTLSAQLAMEAGNVDAALELQGRAPLVDVFLAALRLLPLQYPIDQVLRDDLIEKLELAVIINSNS